MQNSGLPGHDFLYKLSGCGFESRCRHLFLCYFIPLFSFIIITFIHFDFSSVRFFVRYHYRIFLVFWSFVSDIFLNWISSLLYNCLSYNVIALFKKAVNVCNYATFLPFQCAYIDLLNKLHILYICMYWII